MVWTRFMDMHSGGGQKEKWSKILIETNEQEARAVFFRRFGHNPERVTCTCCGADYSISQEETLEEITGYDRNCRSAWFRPDGTECEEGEAWKRGVGITAGYSNRYVEEQCTRHNLVPQYIPLQEYCAQDDVLVIASEEITDEERKTEVPVQGYVWA